MQKWHIVRMHAHVKKLQKLIDTISADNKLTEEEIAENERLWREENDENLTPPPGDQSAEMRGAGVSGAGIEGDLGGLDDEAVTGDEAPIEGGEGTPPDTATGAEPGATPPATDQTV